MNGCIRFIRWFCSIVVLVLLLIVVLAGIPISSLSHMITQRETIKRILSSSQIYDQVLDIGIELISSEMDDNGEPSTNSKVELQTQNPQFSIPSNIKEMLPPSYFQNRTEIVIDAMYDWLEGKTDRPEFTISLVDNDDMLITLLSSGFEAKIQSLPTCDSSYTSVQTENPLELTCLPQDFDPQSIESFIRENQEQEEFQIIKSKTVVTSESLQISDKTTETAQTAYTILSHAVIAIATVILLLSGLLLLLIPGIRTGSLITGICILVPSLIFLALSFLEEPLYEILSTTISSSMATDMQASLFNACSPLIQAIISAFLMQIRIFSSILAGFSILLCSIRFIPKSCQTPMNTHSGTSTPTQLSA